MKPLYSSIAAVGGCLLASCSLGSSQAETKKAYDAGFNAGVQNEIKRRYWADQNATVPLPPEDQATAAPLVVPEHTAPDGVIIEEHEIPATTEIATP